MQSQSILFLQGPLGPFFRELSKEFSAHGYATHKINFNGGDRFYCGADYSVDYVDTVEHWPVFLESYLVKHAIKAIFLMGDCRLYHRRAKPVCDRLGVRFMVFEEGYLRPDTITLEKDGVNYLTSMDCSAINLAAASRQRMAAAVAMPPSMRKRVMCAVLYYWAAYFQRDIFTEYQHHRAFLPVREGARWVRGFFRKHRSRCHDNQVERQLTGDLSKQFFLVALQVHDDSQMTYHSDYHCVESFIGDVIASFARHAEKKDVLVFKHHPMDRGYADYRQIIERLALRFDLMGRVMYCYDIPLPALYRHTRGIVTVNSTVGISALLHGLPVKVTGRAFYDILNLTSQCSLDQFWRAPEPVHSELFNRLHSLIFRETQVNGSFFKKLPLTCRNVRLFYEAKFCHAAISDVINVVKPVQVVTTGEQAVA